MCDKIWYRKALHWHMDRGKYSVKMVHMAHILACLRHFKHLPANNLGCTHEFWITQRECAVWWECYHLMSQTPGWTDRALTQTLCTRIHAGSCLAVDAWRHPILDATSWCHTRVGSSPWRSQAWKWYVQWMARPNNRHGLFASDVLEEQRVCGHLETGSSAHRTCTNEQKDDVTC
jgi:hypothetical protein